MRDIPRDAFSEVPGALPTCWAFRVGKTLSALMLYSYARARARFFQAPSYARNPRIWDQVAGRLTEIAPVEFVLPKFQNRLQV